VLTLAGSPDFATASEHQVVEARRLLAHAVHFLHPTPRVRITAPTHVQTVVSDDPPTRTLRVHFLGYTSPPQTTPAKERPYVLPGLIEDAPQYRATLTMRERPRSARALNGGTRVQRRGQDVTLAIDDIHEVVVLKY